MEKQKNEASSGILSRLIPLMGKFASASVLATLVDFVLFFILADNFFSKTNATTISRSVGMLINFLMQKKFVFQTNRNVWVVFLLTMLVSLGGLWLGRIIMDLIGDWAIWETYSWFKIFPKIIETALVFFYNFFMKRFAFEKRFF